MGERQEDAMDPLLICGAAVCAATAYLGVLPPPEYDKPYTGGITVTRASSPDDVRRLCNHTVATNPLGLGCAHKNNPLPGRCWIIVAPDKDIVAAGFTTKIVLRHETGHCNGWPSHHPGARIAFIQDRGQENTKTQTATPGEPVKAASPKAVEPVIEPVKWLGEPAKARNQPPKPEPVKAVEPPKPVALVKAVEPAKTDPGDVGRWIGEAAMAEAARQRITIKVRDDNSRQPWRARTAKPVEPVRQPDDNLGAAIAREPMQNVFDKAVVISLRSSLTSIVGIPRTPSHIVP